MTKMYPISMHVTTWQQESMHVMVVAIVWKRHHCFQS